MDRGAWQATIHRVAKSQMRLKRLSMQHIYVYWVSLIAQLAKNLPAMQETWV